ncbi:acyl carrier protein [Actinophytocola sp.]|jgi:methoxymalonate biosynthesis acyl carrier protein|uniref:acyl carrier protein n=1 Tax=Actinophytocola sp. TaxID=1872138 RepID=UPI002EDA54AA
MTSDSVVTDAGTVASTISDYLEAKANAPVSPDTDLAAAGVLTSMVAMEIVVFLESTFAVSVVGRDLKLDNFRTVDNMVALVTRLRENPGDV